MVTTERRLQRADWIAGAIEQLRSGGIDAVRIDTLAPKLGVSRGSFYWHFRDRADLLEALLESWESETPELIRGAEICETPYYRLLRFFTLAEASPHPPDAAVFAWARCDPQVAVRVEAIERQRLEFFTTQMRESGLDSRQAARVAELLYVATLGWLERRARSTNRTASFGAFGRNVSDLILTLIPESAPPSRRKPRPSRKQKKRKDPQ